MSPTGTTGGPARTGFERWTRILVKRLEVRLQGRRARIERTLSRHLLEEKGWIFGPRRM